MTLYDVAQPRWVAEFNALEEKKPHNMQIRLDPQTTTMEDFIESADNDELCQTVIRDSIEEFTINGIISDKEKLIALLKEEFEEVLNECEDKCAIMSCILNNFTIT